MSAAYEHHPVADIFPMMSDQEFSGLVEDIRDHGLREPIWLHQDGRIIDGRNRAQACDFIGIYPDIRTYDGDDSDLVAFVLSLNLHRRHLNESQRAMVAARIAQLPRGANQHVEISTPSQAAAAEMLNVSRDSVIKAKKVQQEGGADLAALVDRGEIAVSAAAQVAAEAKDRLTGVEPDRMQAVVRDVIAEKRETIKAAQAKADEVRQHNDWVREFNQTVDPSVIAHANEIGRRLDAVARIADGCAELLRLVDGIDPDAAVREAHDTNRARLAVVHDALAYLTRVADAMTLETVA